ncbi:MAG: hypothetical protein IH948_06610, partial [Bacteroidetes bacterium]|nr:hypothetical protein [Bacteroidota bacterium]
MGSLRFLLAISVLLTHARSEIFGFGFLGGQIAVQAFYIISGFYMTLVLNEKYIGVNGTYRLFITNRCLRIFPTYWFILMLTLLLPVLISFADGEVNWGRANEFVENNGNLNVGSLAYLVFTNVALFFQDVVMFLGIDPNSGALIFTSDFSTSQPAVHRFLMVPQSWTLGIEL